MTEYLAALAERFAALAAAVRQAPGQAATLLLTRLERAGIAAGGADMSAEQAVRTAEAESAAETLYREAASPRTNAAAQTAARMAAPAAASPVQALPEARGGDALGGDALPVPVGRAEPVKTQEITASAPPRAPEMEEISRFFERHARRYG